MLEKYNHLLFKEYQVSYQGLALYRICFALVYLLFLGVPAFSWLSDVAAYLYTPQAFNIARWIVQDIPSDGILIALDLSILLCLVAILFGYRIRAASIAFTILVITGFSMKFSLGKIGHGIMFMVLPGIMAFSGWGSKLSVDAKRNSNTDKEKNSTYIPFIAALILGFAMFTAGVEKINGGWLSPDLYGTFHHFHFQYTFHGADAFLAPFFGKGLPLVVWKLMDYITVFFELMFLPAILNKRIFQYFCAAAILFHIGTMLIFNIPYVNNLLAYLLFIRWEAVVELLKKKRTLRRIASVMRMKYFIIAAGIFLFQHLIFMFIFDDNLIRDKLISPISIINLFSGADFRHIRALILLPLAVIVMFGQYLLPSGQSISKKATIIE